MITDVNSEDRLVQKTFAEYLRDALGWEPACAWTEETLVPIGTSGSGKVDEMVSRGCRPITRQSRRTWYLYWYL